MINELTGDGKVVGEVDQRGESLMCYVLRSELSALTSLSASTQVQTKTTAHGLIPTQQTQIHQSLNLPLVLLVPQVSILQDQIASSGAVSRGRGRDEDPSLRCVLRGMTDEILQGEVAG